MTTEQYPTGISLGSRVDIWFFFFFFSSSPTNSYFKFRSAPPFTALPSITESYSGTATGTPRGQGQMASAGNLLEVLEEMSEEQQPPK